MSSQFLFLIILGLLSNTYCQLLGNGVGCNNCFGKGLTNGFGGGVFGSGFGHGFGPGLPLGYGDVSITGELPVTGNTALNGQVPVIGYVNFEGYLPAGGLVSVAPSCGCI